MKRMRERKQNGWGTQKVQNKLVDVIQICGEVHEIYNGLNTPVKRHTMK